ncbi:hypothetical protein BESB_085010 [Besnoitia besnoiti]|uniref:AMP-activated protein kinase glycogen-binding domain-containing protein n=1 Tax=Besnoitia besnoiti TaxID=94643 RepID=A0A2A9MD46_BESBE|nr:hypothetical protein BESB_085010 [Besnoitia besnoiti]PFH33302.1 hypothetical protein BESB_085010 [Besnoitia besnoiti]
MRPAPVRSAGSSPEVLMKGLPSQSFFPRSQSSVFETALGLSAPPSDSLTFVRDAGYLSFSAEYTASVSSPRLSLPKFFSAPAVTSPGEAICASAGSSSSPDSPLRPACSSASRLLSFAPPALPPCGHAPSSAFPSGASGSSSSAQGGASLCSRPPSPESRQRDGDCSPQTLTSVRSAATSLSSRFVALASHRGRRQPNSSLSSLPSSCLPPPRPRSPAGVARRGSVLAAAVAALAGSVQNSSPVSGCVSAAQSRSSSPAAYPTRRKDPVVSRVRLLRGAASCALRRDADASSSRASSPLILSAMPCRFRAATEQARVESPIHFTTPASSHEPSPELCEATWPPAAGIWVRPASPERGLESAAATPLQRTETLRSQGYTRLLEKGHCCKDVANAHPGSSPRDQQAFVAASRGFSSSSSLPCGLMLERRSSSVPRHCRLTHRGSERPLRARPACMQARCFSDGYDSLGRSRGAGVPPRLACPGEQTEDLSGRSAAPPLTAECAVQEEGACDAQLHERNSAPWGGGWHRARQTSSSRAKFGGYEDVCKRETTETTSSGDPDTPGSGVDEAEELRDRQNEASGDEEPEGYERRCDAFESDAAPAMTDFHRVGGDRTTTLQDAFPYARPRLLHHSAAISVQRRWRERFRTQALEFEALVCCIRQIRSMAAAEIQRIYRGCRLRRVLREEVHSLVLTLREDEVAPAPSQETTTEGLPRKEGTRTVELVGAFGDNPWHDRVPMRFCSLRRCYAAVRPYVAGRHLFKFIVDGRYQCSSRYSQVEDSNGNVNNCIDVVAPVPPALALASRFPWPCARAAFLASRTRASSEDSQALDAPLTDLSRREASSQAEPERPRRVFEFEGAPEARGRLEGPLGGQCAARDGRESTRSPAETTGPRRQPTLPARTWERLEAPPEARDRPLPRIESAPSSLVALWERCEGLLGSPAVPPVKEANLDFRGDEAADGAEPRPRTSPGVAACFATVDGRSGDPGAMWEELYGDGSDVLRRTASAGAVFAQAVADQDEDCDGQQAADSHPHAELAPLVRFPRWACLSRRARQERSSRLLPALWREVSARSAARLEALVASRREETPASGLAPPELTPCLAWMSGAAACAPGARRVLVPLHLAHPPSPAGVLSPPKARSVSSLRGVSPATNRSSAEDDGSAGGKGARSRRRPQAEDEVKHIPLPYHPAQRKGEVADDVAASVKPSRSSATCSFQNLERDKRDSMWPSAASTARSALGLCAAAAQRSENQIAGPTARRRAAGSPTCASLRAACAFAAKSVTGVRLVENRCCTEGHVGAASLALFEGRAGGAVSVHRGAGSPEGPEAFSLWPRQTSCAVSAAVAEHPAGAREETPGDREAVNSCLVGAGAHPQGSTPPREQSARSARHLREQTVEQNRKEPARRNRRNATAAPAPSSAGLAGGSRGPVKSPQGADSRRARVRGEERGAKTAGVRGVHTEAEVCASLAVAESEAFIPERRDSRGGARRSSPSLGECSPQVDNVKDSALHRPAASQVGTGTPCESDRRQRDMLLTDGKLPEAKNAGSAEERSGGAPLSSKPMHAPAQASEEGSAPAERAARRFATASDRFVTAFSKVSCEGPREKVLSLVGKGRRTEPAFCQGMSNRKGEMKDMGSLCGSHPAASTAGAPAAFRHSEGRKSAMGASVRDRLAAASAAPDTSAAPNREGGLARTRAFRGPSTGAWGSTAGLGGAEAGGPNLLDDRRKAAAFLQVCGSAAPASRGICSDCVYDEKDCNAYQKAESPCARDGARGSQKTNVSGSCEGASSAMPGATAPKSLTGGKPEIHSDVRSPGGTIHGKRAWTVVVAQASSPRFRCPQVEESAAALFESGKAAHSDWDLAWARAYATSFDSRLLNGSDLVMPHAQGRGANAIAPRPASGRLDAARTPFDRGCAGASVSSCTDRVGEALRYGDESRRNRLTAHSVGTPRFYDMQAGRLDPREHARLHRHHSGGCGGEYAVAHASFISKRSSSYGEVTCGEQLPSPLLQRVSRSMSLHG